MTCPNRSIASRDGVGNAAEKEIEAFIDELGAYEENDEDVDV